MKAVLLKREVKNKIRIIAGVWRSRQLAFVDAPGLRPTPARVRETLFNWLQYDIAGSRCLDLFAGSGALGFEAASRGAGEVVLVEQNASVFQQLQENAALLSADTVKCVQQDAFSYLSSLSQAFDLVFLDPPFERDLAVQCCQALESGGWLTDHAKVYIEAEKKWSQVGIPENWRLLKSRQAGEVGYHLFSRDAG